MSVRITKPVSFYDEDDGDRDDFLCAKGFLSFAFEKDFRLYSFKERWERCYHKKNGLVKDIEMVKQNSQLFKKRELAYNRNARKCCVTQCMVNLCDTLNCCPHEES